MNGPYLFLLYAQCSQPLSMVIHFQVVNFFFFLMFLLRCPRRLTLRAESLSIFLDKSGRGK